MEAVEQSSLRGHAIKLGRDMGVYLERNTGPKEGDFY